MAAKPPFTVIAGTIKVGEKVFFSILIAVLMLH